MVFDEFNILHCQTLHFFITDYEHMEILPRYHFAASLNNNKQTNIRTIPNLSISECELEEYDTGKFDRSVFTNTSLYLSPVIQQNHQQLHPYLYNSIDFIHKASTCQCSNSGSSKGRTYKENKCISPADNSNGVERENTRKKKPCKQCSQEHYCEFVSGDSTTIVNNRTSKYQRKSEYNLNARGSFSKRHRSAKTSNTSHRSTYCDPYYLDNSLMNAIININTNLGDNTNSEDCRIKHQRERYPYLTNAVNSSHRTKRVLKDKCIMSKNNCINKLLSRRRFSGRSFSNYLSYSSESDVELQKRLIKEQSPLFFKKDRRNISFNSSSSVTSTCHKRYP